MDAGSLIDKHLQLIRIDKNHNIYISKGALKHFVESRKKEMIISHTEEEIFERLYFAIDNIISIYTSYDKTEVKSISRLIYSKQFTDSRDHNIRIVIDTFVNRYEICSIHFQKRKTPPV